jgi:hypothetical protein
MDLNRLKEKQRSSRKIDDAQRYQGHKNHHDQIFPEPYLHIRGHMYLGACQQVINVE